MSIEPIQVLREYDHHSHACVEITVSGPMFMMCFTGRQTTNIKLLDVFEKTKKINIIIEDVSHILDLPLFICSNH